MLNVMSENRTSVGKFPNHRIYEKDLTEFQAIFMMLIGKFNTLKYTDEFSR